MTDIPQQPPTPPAGEQPPGAGQYALTFDVEYPDRPLNRLTSALRIFTVIPIGIVLAAVEGSGYGYQGGRYAAAGAGGLLFLGPLLMILFRQKYPRWWFDWNRELLRFSNRVGAYGLLMSDRYPSTDEYQYVALEMRYPDVPHDLERWLPLIKWFLAIPHYIVLVVLYILGFFAAIGAWFAILITGRYPRGIFNFLVGVMRWTNRVIAYALVLVTDQYPPFRLEP
jgi:Domain of unknown function (DUF4389)